jgi:hypothetical protein
MTTDIAALGLQVDSDQVAEANLQLRAMPAAASAAERAIQKFEKTTDAAAASNDNFSKRVRRTMADLDFQSQQLKRSAAERERYAAVQRAGVTAESAAGQAIMGSVAALQAQRAAIARQTIVTTGMTNQSTAAAGAIGLMTRALGPLVVAFSAAAAAQAVWQAGMKFSDIDEQAEQVGISAEQLQAWRLVAAQAGVETQQLDQMFVKLQKAMGSANDGNKEMIEKFERLGIKVLDAKGELRDAGDVMPELARGLLAVGSVTERNALAMEFLGKSGTKANTMLKEFAAGSADAVDKAKDLGAIASPETIKAWDQLADKLKVAGAVADTLLATLGAPAAAAAAKELDGIPPVSAGSPLP